MSIGAYAHRASKRTAARRRPSTRKTIASGATLGRGVAAMGEFTRELARAVERIEDPTTRRKLGHFVEDLEVAIGMTEEAMAGILSEACR